MTRLRLRSLVVALVAASAIPLVPSQAVEQGPPYSRGRVCYHHNRGDFSYYGSFCHNDPPAWGYVPNQYDNGAPFNLAAAGARTQGLLAVGGKTSYYNYNPTFYVYAANVVSSASIVEFNSPSATTTVSATGQFELLAKASNPAYNTIRVCLRIVDNGPKVYGGGPYARGLIASDCVNLASQAPRPLAKSASIGPDRKIAIEVEVDNLYNDGGAVVKVTSIGHTES